MTKREHRAKALDYRKAAGLYEARGRRAGRKGPLWDRYLDLLTKSLEHSKLGREATP